MTDSDNCIVYIDIPKPENDDIVVSRTGSTDFLHPGDLLILNIGLDSSTYEDLKDLRAVAVIQELGIESSTKSFDLDGRKGNSQEIQMKIPEWAAPGNYDIRITISNNNLRRVIYRDVKIV